MSSAALQTIHILPNVPPSACGVADYALSLAKKLRDEESVESRFIGAGQVEKQDPPYEVDFPTEVLATVNSASLFEALSKESDGEVCLLLHFSPYGFQKRGVAFWVVRAWKKLARVSRPPRRIIMFHEVAASSSPRNSAFWLRPLQHLVARHLIFSSDSVFTNCEHNRREIVRAARSSPKPISVLPVFSNFGEPPLSPPFSARFRQMVFFTSNLSSQHGRAALWQELESAAAQFGVQRIVMIGKTIQTPADITVPVYHAGFLKPEQVSNLLAESALGFAFVGPELFAKSGIFAAFAAHGVIPVVPVSSTALLDGLLAGVHYARIEKVSDLSYPEVMQLALLKWYSGHSQSMTAHIFASAMRNNHFSESNND